MNHEMLRQHKRRLAVRTHPIYIQMKEKQERDFTKKL